MSSMHDGELQCPQCGHSNPAKADYCWECRHDFVHNERLKARPALLSVPYPDMKLGMFVGGWAIALVMVKISEGVLPDPETDHTKYYSWNPFEYKDDMNRKVLSAHISLFLPRIVLRTIRRGFSLVFAR